MQFLNVHVSEHICGKVCAGDGGGGGGGAEGDKVGTGVGTGEAFFGWRRGFQGRTEKETGLNVETAAEAVVTEASGQG